MAEDHRPRADESTSIVSDPDTDDEAIPEIERFYFFTVSNHNNGDQATSRVSRNIQLRKITFADVRDGLEGQVFKKPFLFMVGKFTVTPAQEKRWRVTRREFGLLEKGDGTPSDPYEMKIRNDEGVTRFY